MNTANRWLGVLCALCLFPLAAIAEEEETPEADPDEMARIQQEEEASDAEDAALDREAISSATGGSVSAEELEAASEQSGEEAVEPDE